MELNTTLRLRLPLHRLALLATVGLTILALPASTMAKDMVLTNDGELLRVTSGKYGEFFPTTQGIGQNTRVLNLEITDSDGTTEPVLVAGTQDWRPEHSPQIVWDAQADSAILLWLSGTGQGQSTLHFGSYSDGTWSQINGLRADGRLVRFDEPPIVTLTEDSYSLQLSNDERVSVSRKIFHLTWREAATARVRYAPIVFIEGLHVGWTEIITLTSVFQSLHQGDQPATLPANLSDLLSVREAADHRSLLVTFAEPEFGRLATISVGIRPMQLVLLGDLIRDRILEHNGFDPEDMVALIDDIYAHIIIIGSRVELNPALTEYVSHEVRDWLVAHGGEFGNDVEALANGTRQQAINISSTVYSMDVDTMPDKQLVLDIGDFLDTNGFRDELVQLLDLNLRADLAAPNIASPQLTAYPSTLGHGLLFAWPRADGNSVGFVENRGDGWSEAKSVHFTDDIDAERAFELLEQKAR